MRTLRRHRTCIHRLQVHTPRFSVYRLHVDTPREKTRWTPEGYTLQALEEKPEVGQVTHVYGYARIMSEAPRAPTRHLPDLLGPVDMHACVGWAS